MGELEEPHGGVLKNLYLNEQNVTAEKYARDLPPWDLPMRQLCDLEMRIDTTELSPNLAAHRIFIKLDSLRFIR